VANKSEHLSHAVLNAVLRNTALQVTQAFLALRSDATTEITGGSYARQAIDFDAPVAGVAESSGDVEFTGMPAVAVTHGALMDASSGGNELYAGGFATSRTFQAGDVARVPAGSVTVEEE
jgi:hypothetical protein